MMLRTKSCSVLGMISSALLALLCGSARAEVMLQYFETEWDEMYRRMPTIAEIGYDYIWIPPPTKAPTGLGTKWGNVGYNLYDRFDLGDIPQRGSWATRYGSRGSLRNMVDNAHYCDVKIIPDIVMNHNGNGPDFRYYPGMKPEDFHVQWQQGYVNTLNYKRGPRMDQWYHGNGYGGTMWQDLASLIDIRTEDNPSGSDPNRFTGGNNTPGWNFVAGANFLRHPGQYDKYPYFPAGYTNENASQMLYRWIAWLGNAMDFDGLRLDAGKHVPYEFFGWRGAGFLHEAQYNFNQRRGFSDGNPAEADQLFMNYVRRDDALIFAEILSPWSEIEYWWGYGGNNDRNPMRFLDYALKKTADSAFNGNLGVLGGFGISYDPTNGITYVWGHDEGGPGKINLAYAYTLTHVGFPMVYFTGNNITWDDYGRTPDKKTWMIPGYDSQALGDQYSDIPNLVYIHQQFARGREWTRWNENNDFFAYERYDDLNGNAQPDLGEGLLLVGLNDAGYDKTLFGVTVSFPVGTVLHDYTGHRPDETVYGGGGGTALVNITIPGNYGQGWVCYAPRNCDGVGAGTVQVRDGGSPAGVMSWVTPGGVHGSSKTQQIARVTTTNLSLDVLFSPAGGPCDAAMLRWGRGLYPLTPTNYFDAGNSIVSGGFEKMNQRNATNWFMDVQVGATNIPEGLHAVRCRVFNQRPAGQPALFNTFTKLIYVDTKGPQLDIARPGAGETVHGDGVAVISNADFTAYGMTVSVDGGAPATAYEIYKGTWKFNLAGLSSGTHMMTVTATEADWAASRQVINTSVYTRVFSVVSNVYSIALNHAEGSTLQVPFFHTTVTAPGAPSAVRLLWNGYEIPFNGGGLTNVFNGQVVFRDYLGNVATDRLWGAFVNGPNFFEAERVDGGVTSRVSRRVTFNLYNINAIDSDGDSLPDNVEMPFIDSNGAPGADQPWPGDSNQNFIPDNNETWQKLNPYNHSTFYSGQWDDQNDFDGDGFSNGAEVMAGYEIGNIYAYNIYDATSKPTGTALRASAASWSPSPALRGQSLQIVYSPNQGPLSNASPVVLHVGHSERTFGTWQGTMDTNMTASGTNWVFDYLVPTNATSVDFVFRDLPGAVWDNNNGLDWQATVQGATGTAFVMDGVYDSTNFLVFDPTNAMRILAAARGSKLYVATYGVAGSAGGNDHFIYVTDELGDAADPAPGWSKAGKVFVNTAAKPYIAAEGENRYAVWYNVSGSVTSAPGALEGEIDLADAFGYVPEAVYIAAVSFGTGNGASLNSQGPYTWNGDNNVDIMEFQRVPIASVSDEDGDGVFDGGRPRMWTVVDGNTNDANYNLRRFFLDEAAGESRSLTVILQPDAGTNAVSNVELFSNLNRRDFAVLPGDEDPDTVTATSQTTYYRAWPMAAIGGGRFQCTVPVSKCGAYRVNARYRINGGAYVYYTDHGLRRDCAVVVSPRKAQALTMYEMNPMTAEAVSDDFYGRSTFRDMVAVNTNRPDVINGNYFGQLGINMIWLQPAHPIGSEGRKTDPATSQPYDPGSPYAVRNYWRVNSVLGDPATEGQALAEFTNFVQALDAKGVGVMLDGTFNHSAWDCQIGEAAVQLFPSWATNAGDLIRAVRPRWYSKRFDYGDRASHYESQNNNDIAVAPDRIDFGKWEDAADFNFGTYDCLVQEPPTDTNNAWASRWNYRFLLEEDRLEPLDLYARELWQYFAYYPLYWLEKTGHPAGTPPAESGRGIDGLRCDFAQGLPSQFWEYCINRTRSVKWDFIFMAESLDGYRTVNGSGRHGVGFRSARHFDVLNENFVFYWRDQFFNYFSYAGANPTTFPTWQAFDQRRNAFDASPLLLNLTSHDEILPHDAQWRVLYGYATLATLDGVPMLFYGQEAGAQNDAAVYTGRGIDPGNNFRRYEINFGKSIPHFQRYNEMTNIWNNLTQWSGGLHAAYARIGRARLGSTALKSQQNYFLSRTDTGQYDPDIFAVAKLWKPGVSAATQEVVFCFVNNNYEGSTNRFATFGLNAAAGGANWFGIDPAHAYNIVDLVATNPAQYIWSPDKAGSDLIAYGLGVWLHENTYEGKQAQFLRLVDRTANPSGLLPDADGDGIEDYVDPDDDNDGLPDAWESQFGPRDPDADDDGDGANNRDEYAAGTDPDDPNSCLRFTSIAQDVSGTRVSWDATTNLNYRLERATELGAPWQQVFFGTALSDVEAVTDASTETGEYYRVLLKP
jgi:hypothetical protein